MKHRQKITWFLSGILVAFLAANLTVPGFAALVGKTIQVYTGIEIFVDGTKLNPTDANGNPVEVFVYNGTTYVPLRAVSEFLGKSATYDSATKRGYIGTAPSQKQHLLDVCPPYQTSYYATFETITEAITIAGTKYTDGFIIGEYRDVFRDYNYPGWALYNLNGQYTTLEFEVGHIDGKLMRSSTLTISLDGKTAYKLELDPYALPQHISIPLNHALQVRIDMDYNGGFYGFVNATLS